MTEIAFYEVSMLLEFGIRNFYSFKEGVVISFKLDANCPGSISQGLSFTPVLCVKGANGSGKTQLLKGLSFLAEFCQRSFSFDPDRPLPIAPFFRSRDPIEFYAEFSIRGITYLYELEATKERVLREVIFKTISKKTRLLERVENKLVYRTAALSKLDAISLRNNASVISTAHQYGMKELADVYGFFGTVASNVNPASGMKEIPVDMSAMAKALDADPNIFGFVKKFISECDVGIVDIQIHNYETKEGEKVYFPVFMHNVDGKVYPVVDDEESSGTKALFRWLALYRVVIDVGGILILDEFDVYLHPHILPKLIGLFLDKSINVNHAQFIFSTHNSEALDLLGRYRTYLVNKKNNASFAFRLDEIPGDVLRNDRPIVPVYNAGKIGGVPRV